MTSLALEPDRAYKSAGLSDVKHDGKQQDDCQQEIAETAEGELAAKFITALEGIRYSTKTDFKGLTLSADRERLSAGKLLSNYNQTLRCISQGVDVNTSNYQGVSAIVIITEAWIVCWQYGFAKPLQFCADIARQLIDRGADLINAQDRSGRTPLVLAIEVGGPNEGSEVEGLYDSFINMLVEAGSCLDPPSPTCNWPTTPLIAAVSGLRRRLSTVKLLLSKKANVNTSIGGMTALLKVVYDGGELFPERISTTLSTLLQHGADCKNHERRLLAAAISHSPESVERFLLECYGSPQPSLYPNENLEDFAEEEPEDSAAATTSVHPPPLSDRRKLSAESLTRLCRYLAQSQKSARSLLRWADGITHTKDGRKEELCSRCREFEKMAIYREWFSHSSSSQIIRQSISRGCAMCQLIKDCLPDAFGAVSLYYYSALSESDSLSKDYYERLIVRGKISKYTAVYGELRFATVDGG